MKTIVSVTTPKQLKLFIDFPHDLYSKDPNYVPELFIAQRDLLTPGKHPFHEHSQLQAFLAYDNNKVVGRIAAILNNNHNTFNKANDGFWGFFDCVDDKEVAKLLFDAAEKWLKEKGTATSIGPVNFSTNEACGLLVDGFDSPPRAMMTYNSPYYLHLIENEGYKKRTDIFAYDFDLSAYKDERLKKMTAIIKERLDRRGIVIRPINLKNFKEEVTKVREVYNSAWDKNLGFVPMTDKEFDYLAKDLKMILDKDFCMVAEHNGKFVGFSLAIPDINQVLIKIKRGRLLPTGIFKLLSQKSKIKAIRIITLGVIEGYRKSGIEQFFYSSIIKNVEEKKMKNAEASWVLEENLLMNKAITEINGKPYKRYRILEKAI
ncbi:hypothetical protein ACI6Q2_22015 [Chitinophagaceae bacterium LWZ2-11]